MNFRFLVRRIGRGGGCGGDGLFDEQELAGNIVKGGGIFGFFRCCW